MARSKGATNTPCSSNEGWCRCCPAALQATTVPFSFLTPLSLSLYLVGTTMTGVVVGGATTGVTTVTAGW